MLKLYDLAIFIRHDDVVHYQKAAYAACGGDAVPTCKKDNNPCELIKYQSLESTTTEGGDGITGVGHLAKDAAGHDADGDRNDRFADPNRYVGYTGEIRTPVPTDHKAYDYGGRATWRTSVKRTCCEPDALLPDGSPRGFDQRMCPPPEASDDLAAATARYGDPPGDYVQMLDPMGSEVCFHNRTLGADIHMASIVDYKPLNEHLYHGINNQTAGILYDEDPLAVWDQDKSDTSFYQLCVAERAKKTACCAGTSAAPCAQPAVTNGNDPNGECAAAQDANADTWEPNLEHDYFWFPKVIINVRKQRLKPNPQPPKPLTPNPNPLKGRPSPAIATAKFERCNSNPFHTHAHHTRTPRARAHQSIRLRIGNVRGVEVRRPRRLRNGWVDDGADDLNLANCALSGHALDGLPVL